MGTLHILRNGFLKDGKMNVDTLLGCNTPKPPLNSNNRSCFVCNGYPGFGACAPSTPRTP